ncbi:MAG: GNAT family N-acetyltransferase [Oscillospiraceae bacterium]|jgi:GNAT superfamily N-acetyltransferase|nr:GNAT family N-acetyltransferase [Oscillospiraceae bacterium]MDE7041937.1 GNAT family N-acetyltransferase [Oscillospiraceae bacterium]
MEYRPFTLEDLPRTAKLYVDYYNAYEDGEGTIETTTKRIHQVMTREDAFGLLLEDKGRLLGFAMGYFEQYDDCQAYDLIEIVVAGERQNQGLGTAFMRELERRVREKGAMLIQLQSVNDAKHEHFYDKLGFKDAKNLVLKTKMLG